MSNVINLVVNFDLAGTSSPPWPEAFVYLDEQHPSVEDPSFAVGLLMMPAPLGIDICSSALRRLPSTNKAVVRRYFHAVHDGKDAQTVFANAIAGAVTSAEFFAFRWTSSNEPLVSRDGELHMHVAALVLDHAQSVVRGQIHVEFARGPTIAIESFRRWLAEHDEVRLQSFVRMGARIPARFPPFSVVESEPERSAGIQVADALLWNHRRVRAGMRLRLPCRNFFERTGFVQRAQWSEQNGPMEKWSYGVHPPVSVASRPFGRMPEDWAAFNRLAVGVERAVHDVARLAAAPRHIVHLMQRVRAASDALRGRPRVACEQQQELLRMFLMLVDTLPLYDGSAERQQLAADAAAVAASMFDLSDGAAISRLDRWADVRTAVDPIAVGWRSAR